MVEVRYQIIHEQSFDYALSNNLSVPIEQAEEAIGAILYALNRNPTGFELVKNPDVYIAKMLPRPKDDLPAFRVWFRINKETGDVFLLYIDNG